jgi:hypothetical protein
MIAGVNFVAMGLAPAANLPALPPAGAAVRMPKALALAMFTPWKISRRDWSMLWYLWGDPISSAREALGIDWEYAEDAHQRHFIAASTGKPADRAIAA